MLHFLVPTVRAAWNGINSAFGSNMKGIVDCIVFNIDVPTDACCTLRLDPSSILFAGLKEPRDLVLLTQPKIRWMTVSFCRGVLKAITSDHNTSNAKERERVVAMGGSIKDNRWGASKSTHPFTRASSAKHLHQGVRYLYLTRLSDFILPAPSNLRGRET